MPKCCVTCWAAEICRYYDRLSNYERPEHCPLVEVPEPHGRLVDADKLVDAIADAIPSAITDSYDFGVCDGIGKMQIALEDAPTVIEAEEEEHDGG